MIDDGLWLRQAPGQSTVNSATAARSNVGAFQIGQGGDYSIEFPLLV